MKWANRAWGALLFLIVGGIGWLAAVLAASIVAGKLIVDGHLTFEEARSMRFITGAIPVLCGLALAWFAVGRKRWQQFWGKSGESRR